MTETLTDLHNETKFPPAPSWLNPEATEYYNRLVPLLQEKMKLEPYHYESVYVGCQAFGNYVMQEKKLKREGRTYKTENGYIKAHPACKVSHDCFNEFTRMLEKFGLTPKDAERLGESNQNDNLFNEDISFVYGNS